MEGKIQLHRSTIWALSQNMLLNWRAKSNGILYPWMCLFESRTGGSSVTVWRRRFDFSIFPISSSILSIFVLQSKVPRPSEGATCLRKRGIFLWGTLSKEVHWLWFIVSTFERGHLIFGRICTYLIHICSINSKSYIPYQHLNEYLGTRSNMPFLKGKRVRRTHPQLLEMHFFKPLFIPSLSVSL